MSNWKIRNEFAVPTLAAPLWNVPSASDPDSKRIGDQKQSARHRPTKPTRAVAVSRPTPGIVQSRSTTGV